VEAFKVGHVIAQEEIVSVGRPVDVVERQNAEVAVGTTQLITSPEHTSQQHG